MKKFNSYFSATAIGSMPHKDAKQALDEVFLNFKQIPFWPQMPKRSFLESMYVQFSEALPGVKINEEEKKIYIDTQSAEKQLEQCYEHYINDDIDYFAISPEYAQGLYAFLKILKEDERRTAKDEGRYIKGHITGPVSFGLTVTDNNKRSIIYNPLLSEALIKVLTMKAKWQIRQFKSKITPRNCKTISGTRSRESLPGEFREFPGLSTRNFAEISGRGFLGENSKIIIFIDEPYLSSIGSAYVNLKKENIIEYINEIIEAIHREGAMAGIHCCGNTDWSIILDTKTDIISFDAYNFIDNLMLFIGRIKLFLEGNGILAWGIVPSSEIIRKETVETLTERIDKGIAKLTASGLSYQQIANASLITPSCGAGTLSDELAGDVFKAAREVSEAMKGKTG